MMSLREALIFEELTSGLGTKIKDSKQECCLCKYLETTVQSVAPGEGTIIHYCGVTNQEVKYGGSCVSGKFKRKD